MKSEQRPFRSPNEVLNTGMLRAGRAGARLSLYLLELDCKKVTSPIQRTGPSPTHLSAVEIVEILSHPTAGGTRADAEYAHHLNATVSLNADFPLLQHPSSSPPPIPKLLQPSDIFFFSLSLSLSLSLSFLPSRLFLFTIHNYKTYPPNILCLCLLPEHTPVDFRAEAAFFEEDELVPDRDNSCQVHDHHHLSCSLSQQVG